MRSLFLLTFFVCQTINAQVPEALREKLGFQTGNYRLVRGDEDNCLGDLDLAYEGDAQNSVLRLGQKFIFSHIESTTFKEPGAPGCEFSTINETDTKSLVQVTRYRCKEKSQNYRSTVVLKFEKSHLRLSYARSSEASRINFKCEYSRQANK